MPWGLLGLGAARWRRPDAFIIATRPARTIALTSAHAGVPPCGGAGSRGSGLAVPVVQIGRGALRPAEALGVRAVLARVGVFAALGLLLRANAEVAQRRVGGVGELVWVRRPGRDEH